MYAVKAFLRLLISHIICLNEHPHLPPRSVLQKSVLQATRQAHFLEQEIGRGYVILSTTSSLVWHFRNISDTSLTTRPLSHLDSPDSRMPRDQLEVNADDEYLEMSDLSAWLFS